MLRMGQGDEKKCADILFRTNTISVGLKYQSPVNQSPHIKNRYFHRIKSFEESLYINIF